MPPSIAEVRASLAPACGFYSLVVAWLGCSGESNMGNFSFHKLACEQLGIFFLTKFGKVFALLGSRNFHNLLFWRVFGQMCVVKNGREGCSGGNIACEVDLPCLRKNV